MAALPARQHIYDFLVICVLSWRVFYFLLYTAQIQRHFTANGATLLGNMKNTPTPKYKRILVKFSGEQLAGTYEAGIDPEVVKWLAAEIQKARDLGIDVIVVAGGGNMIRGAEIVKRGIRRVTGDHMGMLSGLINAMAMTDIFEHQGVATRCMSNIFAQQVAESYSYRLAVKHLERQRVVIIAGGIGRPYFTHDTAAVNLALELDCDLVLKATKVDGVFDKDPKKFSDATKFDTLDFHKAVQDEAIKVMDKAAIGLAMEQKMPVVIYDMMQSDAIANIACGKSIGTLVQ